MQVGWGRPPPRVVHVVGRRVGRVLCVFALWCTGTGAHWPWPPPSAPSQVAAALDNPTLLETVMRLTKEHESSYC